MIPSWLFPILAALPSALLVWGSISLLVLLAMGAGLATHFLLISAPSLLRRWRHVPMAVVRTAADLARMGASWVTALPRRLKERKERRRYHLSLAEWDTRKQLHVPLTHPENVDGSDEAAESGDFPLWLDELLADGIDAGEIVREES